MFENNYRRGKLREITVPGNFCLSLQTEVTVISNIAIRFLGSYPLLIYKDIHMSENIELLI